MLKRSRPEMSFLYNRDSFCFCVRRTLEHQVHIRHTAQTYNKKLKINHTVPEQRSKIKKLVKHSDTHPNESLNTKGIIPVRLLSISIHVWLSKHLKRLKELILKRIMRA